MKIKLLVFFIFAFTSLTYGQKRFVYGKIISEDLETLAGIRIQNSDSLVLGSTGKDGQFKVEIPIEINQLIISGLGWEWTTITLPDDCNHVELILINSTIYDYISARKEDRLRKKRFDKLSELYRLAFEKRIFINSHQCFNQEFSSIINKSAKSKSREY